MADKPKAADLVALPVAASQKQYRGIQVREVKMVAPSCEECQSKRRPRWWERCPHNPYFSKSPRTLTTVVLRCSVCDERVEGQALHCGQSTFRQDGVEETVQYEMVANIRPVRVDEGTNSGRAVERALAKGFRWPQELGIAPMCEFPGCYEPNPSVRTSAGSYCNETEAKIVLHSMGAEAVEVFNDRIRQEQLRRVSIG